MNFIEIRLPFNHTETDFLFELTKKGIKENKYYIFKKSLDARNKKRIDYIYTISKENPYPSFSFEKVTKKIPNLPLIIGLGPSGLFTSLWLLKHGIHSIILEQGDEIKERQKKIAEFIKNGILDEYSNISFGEGGAGAFSDGKLMTRIKSPFVHFVMDTLIEFGAPPNIKYLSKPHLGSNLIRKIFHNIVQYIQKEGVLIHYRTIVEKIQTVQKKNTYIINKIITNKGDFYTNTVFAAIGNSSRNLFNEMLNSKIHIEFKPFAVGVRIEHPVKIINKLMFGDFANDNELGAASYSFAHTSKKTNRGFYSFCMCPGGYIINSSSDKNSVCINGMSNSKRQALSSNSAFVVSINDSDIKGHPVLKGIEFQKMLEKNFYNEIKDNNKGSNIPGQMLIDFLNKKQTQSKIISNSPFSIASCKIHELLPTFIYNEITTGLKILNQKWSGFISPLAIITAPETRTSTPLRILRDKESYESVSLEGLYPVGEGAGYAGGITSSSVDGINAANAFIAKKMS